MTESEPDALSALKPALVGALDAGPVVLAAPTGTGKSTLVPCWLEGRVAVVEPRRLACQALARRVATLTGVPLGAEVGYQVRDDHRATDATRIVYATPGIVLQDPAWLERFDHVVLDEFHERRIDTDWLCAWLAHRRRPFLLMSATVDAEAIAAALGGRYLVASARTHHVEVEYLGAPTRVPEMDGVAPLFAEAVTRASAGEGDVLVFVAGKREMDELEPLARAGAFEVHRLHGGMPLDEQSKVFGPRTARRLILATNVAETSLTLPSVRWVIDTGLVRRTHYYGGRSYLALGPIAEDSAEQRRGRAGRTADGFCLRLWGRSAKLLSRTPPEIQRESLAPMVLWSHAWGTAPEDLPFLDPPPPHSLKAARDELLALAAITETGTLTATGRQLQTLPLDPWYARLLVEARRDEVLAPMIELVALLSAQPPIRVGDADGAGVACDMTALLWWLHKEGAPEPSRAEAVRTIRRLRLASGLSTDLGRLTRVEVGEVVPRLARCVLRADPRAAHISRVHKGGVAWAAGGTELGLARDSLLHDAPMPEALLVLSTHAVGRGRERRLLITRATPVPLSWLAAAGLGEDRVHSPSLEQGRLLARVERVYAGRVLVAQAREVQGAVAREALVQLLLRGSVFRKAIEEAKLRLERRTLLEMLASTARGKAFGLTAAGDPPELAAFLHARLLQLGFEAGEDLQLLGPDDFLPDDVPAECRSLLDSEFPLTVDAGGCSYRVKYDLSQRQVLLHVLRGHRATAPPLAFLPAFRGFRICVEVGGSLRTVRERG